MRCVKAALLCHKTATRVVMDAMTLSHKTGACHTVVSAYFWGNFTTG